MFLTARILFLNEKDYIWYALKSVYDAVDAIVVVEGCIEEYGNVKSMVSSEGLSTDGSDREVNRFIKDDDPDHKVNYSRIGFVKNYAELANIALDFFPEETTHFLNIDADEVYKAEDVLRVKKLFEEFSGLCGVEIDRIHFYLDFWTRRISSQVKLESTGGTKFRKFYPEEYYPERGAEHMPQLHGDPVMDLWLPWWEDDLGRGIKTALEKGLDGITLRRYMMPQYHYGWVRSEAKMMERLVQTMRRVDVYSGKGEFADMSDAELVEYAWLYNPVCTGVIGDVDILEPFVDEHPEVMKTHPYYGMHKEDFGWP